MNRRSFISCLLSLFAAPTALALPPAGGAIKVRAMSLYGSFAARTPTRLFYLNSIYGKMGAKASLAALRAWERERDEQDSLIPPYCIEDARATYLHLRARLKTDLEKE